MIDWQEEGVILSVRPHGEGSAIVEALTEGHGRHAGLVRGGAGRRMAGVLMPGAQMALVWKARLEDHLGSYTVEPLRSRAAQAMGSRLALAGLNAVTALLCLGLPERDPHPPLYRRTVALLDLMGQDGLWPLAYLNWELAFLDEMGFGLDLASCALSGSTEDLAYVSPRSGRAVARAAAGDWAPRLLPLPPVMRGEGEAGAADIALALATTGHFIQARLLHQAGDRPLPPARARLIAAIAGETRENG